MNGLSDNDKIKLFSAISRIEGKLECLQCNSHSEILKEIQKDVSANAVQIEKAKWTTFMAVFASIASLSSVAGVILIFIQYIKPMK